MRRRRKTFGINPTPSPRLFKVVILKGRSIIFAGMAMVAISLVGCGRSPDPTETIRDSYAWYLRMEKEGRNPLVDNRAELRKFVTDAFLASLERTNFDPQPSADAKMSIDEMKVHGNSAVAKVSLSSRLFGRHHLEVRLLQQERAWKIDDVKVLEQMLD